MTKVEIPEYVVLTLDREKFEPKIAIDLNSVGENFKALKDIKDLSEVIADDVKSIKADDVNCFVDVRIAEIETTKMLTIDAKDRTKKEWEDIRKKALSLIARIQDVIQKYPSATFAQIDGKLTCTNGEDIVFECCKRRVPQQDVAKHYELIQEVRAAIDILWDFEEKHDWPSKNFFTLEKTLEHVGQPQQLATEWVYRAWQREYREKHPYLQGAYDTIKKSSFVDQNARLAEKRKKYFDEHPEDFIPLGNKKSPYENMQRGSSGDCLDYSVEMK